MLPTNGTFTRLGALGWMWPDGGSVRTATKQRKGTHGVPRLAPAADTSTDVDATTLIYSLEAGLSTMSGRDRFLRLFATLELDSVNSRRLRSRGSTWSFCPAYSPPLAQGQHVWRAGRFEVSWVLPAKRTKERARVDAHLVKQMEVMEPNRTN